MIDRMALGVALAGMLTCGAAVQDSSAAGRPVSAAARLQADPADSLYRAARQALDRRDYTRAAELFARVPSRFPRSAYAGDAYYWNAFALYRVGGTSQLHAALDALDAQRATHPKAATRGDAQALERRIEGELARRGDQDARRAGCPGGRGSGAADSARATRRSRGVRSSGCPGGSRSPGMVPGAWRR